MPETFAELRLGHFNFEKFDQLQNDFSKIDNNIYKNIDERSFSEFEKKNL